MEEPVLHQRVSSNSSRNSIIKTAIKVLWPPSGLLSNRSNFRQIKLRRVISLSAASNSSSLHLLRQRLLISKILNLSCKDSSKIRWTKVEVRGLWWSGIIQAILVQCQKQLWRLVGRMSFCSMDSKKSLRVHPQMAGAPKSRSTIRLLRNGKFRLKVQHSSQWLRRRRWKKIISRLACLKCMPRLSKGSSISVRLLHKSW